MALELLSFQQLYNLAKDEMQTVAPEVTDFTEGSIADAMLGITATLAEEVQQILVDRFNNTFIELAEGADLDKLLIDHFGVDFTRPAAAKAGGVVTFSRPTFTFGAVTIPAGTEVSTAPNSSGVSQKYTTVAAVTLGASDLTINATIEASIAGSAGNVQPSTVLNIESSLLDSSIVVTNAAVISGGAEESTDAEYRDFARNKIETLRGGTCQGIQSAALTVPGVENAVAVEVLEDVIGWDVGLEQTVGDSFRLPRANLYIADANGSASQTLINQVTAEVDNIRACGVQVNIIGATAVALNWKAVLSFNPGGPNFAQLSVDPQPILNSMTDYINSLPIGRDFIRYTANQAILAIWGPTGSNDLTDFDTIEPTGEVDVDAVEKLIAGTMEAI